MDRAPQDLSTGLDICFVGLDDCRSRRGGSHAAGRLDSDNVSHLLCSLARCWLHPGWASGLSIWLRRDELPDYAWLWCWPCRSLGILLIIGYAIDPAALTQTDTLGFVAVKVFPFVPIRMLIVIGNIFGTFAFVGAALYSVWAFWQSGLSRERMVGVLLVAIGGLVAASAHSIGALGGPGLFRVSELAAISLIFAGYLLSTAPAQKRAAVEVVA